jgi:hypothetical protein
LAQAAGKADLPAGGVAASRDGGEHSTGLPARERHLRGLPQGGWLNEPAGVACEVAALDLLFQADDRIAWTFRTCPAAWPSAIIAA